MRRSFLFLLPLLFNPIVSFSAEPPKAPAVAKTKKASKKQRAAAAPSLPLDKSQKKLLELFGAMRQEPWAETPKLGSNPVDQEVILNEKKDFSPRKTSPGCPTKIFAEKLGPVRNQGGMGWCFASVAADILSAAAGRRLSDIDLSLQYFRFQPGSRVNSERKPVKEFDSVTDFWSGFIEKAVNVGAKTGVCTEGEVSSADFLYEKGVEDALLNDEAMPSMSHISRHALLAIESIAGLNMDELDKMGEATCDSVITAQRLIPNLSTWQILSTVSRAQTKEEAIHWLIKQGCERAPLPLPKGWKYRNYLPRGKGPYGGFYIGMLDKFLNEEIPVAVGLDAKRFFAETASAPGTKPMMHAVLLVGREFRGGECKYLVRNSYGPGCTSYAPPYNEKENCEKGHFWISEKDFHETVRAIGAGK